MQELTVAENTTTGVWQLIQVKIYYLLAKHQKRTYNFLRFLLIR